MKSLTDIIDAKTLFRYDDFKPTIILLLAALLPALHRYFGSIEFASRTFTSATSFETVFFMFVSAFVLFFVVPYAVVRLIFREGGRDYGIVVGDWRRGLTLTLILFPIIAGTILYPGSQTAEMRAFYPFDKAAGDSVAAFLKLQLVRGLFFYSAWEFFFRGFMLFGLRKYLGDWLAICIQTIPSCLWHIGTPTGETFSSIVGGVLFGIIAVRTRSILWPLLLHYLIGVGLDFFVVITH